MSKRAEEPTTAEAVAAWIDAQMEACDPFAALVRRSESHRAEHGCDVYPSNDGNLLGVLAAAIGARRILEVGCGLGYSALWLAHGAGPGGAVESIEQDASHAAIARAIVQEHGYGDRIVVHTGRETEVLPRLSGPYDLIFYDAFIPGPDDLAQFARLARSGGLLITSNLFLGRYNPDLPELEQGADYRRRIIEDGDWQTAFAGTKAISVRR